MNPERWQRIEELFGAVIDRPAAERESYLTRVCIRTQRRSDRRADRALHSHALDRTRRDGRGIRGRAGRRAVPAAGRDQDHQTWDGHGFRARPIPARATDSGLARASTHRAAVRRRRDARRLALLRDRVRRRRTDYSVLPWPAPFSQRETKALRKVCSAVQHARQKLVVHRDLKPSNILITED